MRSWLAKSGTTTLLLGALLGTQFHRIFPTVDAAPQDVQGSPNVAVDTYRNSKGSYVVWSDGRITDVKVASGDLGHPYADPAASASIVRADVVPSRSKGSPNVAVKALVRSDASYVLFADGSMKKPANANAAAAGSDGQKIVRGMIDLTTPPPSGDGWSAGFTPGSGTNGYHVTFDSPFTTAPSVVAQPIYTSVPLSPAEFFPPIWVSNVSTTGFDLQVGPTTFDVPGRPPIAPYINAMKRLNFTAFGD